MKISIVIGRFQVSELTIAHEELIRYAISKGDKLIIFVGVSPLKSSFNNPLTFGMRSYMISDYLHQIGKIYTSHIIPIKDVFNIDLWSQNLDKQISEFILPTDDVTLYGGRDSFQYTGKYTKIEIDTIISPSGTEIRNEIGQYESDSVDFRKGVIWATQNQYTSVFATVDVIIYDGLKDRILLAKKPSDKLYRFVGGFSDVNDESYENTVIREVKEETGLEVTNVKYIGSHAIKDGRYAKEKNKIKTMLFLARYDDGIPVAKDDISEVKWFQVSDLKETDIEEVHLPLYKMIMDYFYDGGS